jgi:hypothetical protein
MAVVVVAVLRVSIATGITAIATRNKNKIRANIKQRKGERGKHCLRCRFSIMLLFTFV